MGHSISQVNRIILYFIDRRNSFILFYERNNDVYFEYENSDFWSPSMVFCETCHTSYNHS